MRGQFLLILSSVFVLTIFCGGAELYLAVLYGTQMPPPVAEYQEQLSHLFTAGAVAIFALLGSRGRK
jgi:hypothetical protein